VFALMDTIRIQQTVVSKFVEMVVFILFPVMMVTILMVMAVRQHVKSNHSTVALRQVAEVLRFVGLLDLLH
jgi:hypothetical protein